MNFKDLQLNLSKLTLSARTQVAKNNPLQNHDTKALNMWLFEERNLLANIKSSAHLDAETNKAFLEWVKEEMVKNEKSEAYSQDIQDVGSALFTLLNKQVELDKQYAERYQLYRRALKSMRDKERRLNDLAEKKQSVIDRIEHLKRSNPNSKKIVELEKESKEIAVLHDKEHETFIDYKRFILKEAFYLRFNALSEHAEKSALIAKFGKQLIDLLDINADGQSDLIIMDALLTVDGWEPSDQRYTHTQQEDLLLLGAEDATLLTDNDLHHKQTLKQEYDKEFDEKASSNYYYQLYHHTQQQQPLKDTSFSDLPPAYSNDDNIQLNKEK